MRNNAKRVDILGIPIDEMTQVSVLAFFKKRLRRHTQSLLHLSTVNTEFIIRAKKDDQFAEILKKTDLNVPDGIGVVWAMRQFGSNIQERVTGIDLMIDTCKLAVEEKASIFLLGAAPGVAEQAAHKLQMKFANLKIAGMYAGSPDKKEAPRIIEMINESGANILFVAYSAPDPDKWINAYKSQLKNVRIAFGVGGSFDFVAGKVKRAPQLIQHIGLEWLWRLLKDPKRFRRQLSIPRFIYSIIIQRFQ